MIDSAAELISATRETLAPGEEDNRLVPLIAQGKAPRSVFEIIAAEEHRIVRSDWRSFLTLAARCDEPIARNLFSTLAQGEKLALDKLSSLTSALGMGADELSKYHPKAGCQAYSAYVAWLALNADPIDVIVSLLANFSAWGNYCATIAHAMREYYEFSDKACEFFDFFAVPSPGLESQATAAVQRGIETGKIGDQILTYGRLFQNYELMFWNTIADEATS